MAIGQQLKEKLFLRALMSDRTRGNLTPAELFAQANKKDVRRLLELNKYGDNYSNLLSAFYDSTEAKANAVLSFFEVSPFEESTHNNNKSTMGRDLPHLETTLQSNCSTARVGTKVYSDCACMATMC